jgi:ribose 5-phosphate isomerase B
MKLGIGADHAGFSMKEDLKSFLESRGHELVDVGTFNEESVDYPDMARRVAELVRDGEVERGILICGTGVGMAMAANKVSGVRAASCSDLLSARLSRAHNDANVLTLGARITAPYYAREILEAWLTTPFEGGRHERRVDMIRKMEGEV